MAELSDASTAIIVLLFLLAAVIVGVGGVWLTRLADRLADLTGLGEALTGAIFLGALTSLSGSVTSVSAAWQGHPELAVSNGIGGIAAQTAFLVLADLSYRHANLEHAAASLLNIFSGCLLIVLLNVTLIATFLPDVAVLGVHPATILLFAVYIIGVKMAGRIRTMPMWVPMMTAQTRPDTPAEQATGLRSTASLIALTLLLGGIVALAGYFVADLGIVLARKSDMSEGLIGTLFTAVATSTPELVTTLTAVRRGALTLAVGGILGGNTFDVLFTAFADVGYREGSIYHSMQSEQIYLLVLTTLMTGVLLLGLLRRERHGMINIGFESVTLLTLYVGGIVILARGLG